MNLEDRIREFITAVATDYKQLRTWISGSSTGDLTGLVTSNKASLVGAINEVATSSTTPPNASTTVKGLVELANLAEVAAGVDTTLAVTPEGVRQERIALKAEILGTNVPAALDTLDELAAAINDDASYAAATTAALGNRVRVDTATQGLNPTQKSNARTNIDAVATADVGNTDLDLVALYNSAKA